MEYLLKVTAVVTIFYINYKVFLQRDTFFESNRWFLIIGLIASLLIPFLVIPIYIEYTPVVFDNVTINGQVVTDTVEKPFNILDYLPLIYGLGVVFFSTRFFIQLFSLIKIIHKNKGIKKERFVFIETQNSTSPFSFFKWIVYNPETFSQTELEHIIEHEKTHAKQYHSIDILITQLFCVLLWFNPFIWLYNKDLKQNLEFIADKRTLNQYNCKKSYQYTLLKTSMPSHQMALSNHFYNSLIKKRIVMLHKSKSKKINQLKYALVIPIVALFLMGFNTEDIYVEKQNPAQNNSIINSAEKLNDANTYYILDTQKDSDFESMKNHFATKEYFFEISNLKRTETGLITGITISIKNETSSANFSTSSILPIKPIKIILDEENNTVSIGNLSDTDKKVLTGFPSQEKAYEYKISKNLNNLLPSDEFNKALLILNGTEVKLNAIKDLNADDIKNLNVLKGEKAIEKYGEKGKDGVIEITSKEKAKIEGKIMNNVTVVGYGTMSDSTKTIRIGHKLDVGKDKHPLVIVDGKESPQEEFEKLNPDKIETMTIIKAENAIKKYGDKGKNGVIEIIRKEKTKTIEGKTINEVTVAGYAAKPDSTLSIRMNNRDSENKGIIYKNSRMKLNGNATLILEKDKNYLIIINGKEKTLSEATSLIPENIESINILEDKSASKKYGKKAKNGVIEITTKK
ncbi:M56 family metallopeptidase [Confluentibacter lentus]|uniref:M56 family metallopeptidase n=1 Tax=Confluentibacter lentus TaxID=1699412 RepID=UPI000C2917F4|nr:M56 family metallopeptidase [Confluentibacter lentus]